MNNFGQLSHIVVVFDGMAKIDHLLAPLNVAQQPHWMWNSTGVAYII